MTITISQKAIQGIKNDDAVLIPRREYERLLASQIPTVFLTGKAARRLDGRVSAALKEYKSGKLKSVKSLAELLK